MTAIVLTFSSAAGHCSGKPASLSAVISPPWWRTWWALLMWIALAGLLFWRAYVHLSQRKALRQIVEREKQEIQNLKQMYDLKSRFFAYISHEFRTPLTMIIGSVTDLHRYIKDKGAEKKLDMIRSNAELLLELVNQILELSKISAKGLDLHLTFGDLAHYIKNIVTMFSSQAQNSQITLVFKSLPEHINTYYDREILRKIVTNLLSNAIKFTMPGGRIDVSLSEVSNPVNTNATNRIILVVSDNGIGIRKDDLPFIFDRFAHAHKSVKRPGEGIGLGLCLVKELVQIHHGDITADSIEGQETTFTVTLADLYSHFKAGADLNLLSHLAEERQKSDDVPPKIFLPKAIAEIEAVEPSLAPDGSKTILLIEDDDQLRVFLAELLTPKFFVIETKNGEDGMRKALERSPDIILCDLKLPGKNGFEVTTTLKADARTSHIPIIMLTARADDASKIKGLQIGADGYITKPFNTELLLASIENLIGQRYNLKKLFSTSLNLKTSEITTKPQDQQFLDKVLFIIENNIQDESFSVERLARDIGISVSQLSRKLNNLIDKSTNQVIQSVRLQRAADLLMGNCCSISEVAYRVGYNSSSYFAKVFHKEYNCTPQQFVRKHAVKQKSSIL